MNFFGHSLLCVLLGCFFLFPTMSIAQRDKLPAGSIVFKDSVVKGVLLDLKNLDKGILRYRKPGQENFLRASSEANSKSAG